MNRLSGKTAFVTGAASGIGRAIAILFAEEGASVVLADCDNADPNVMNDIIQAGGTAYFQYTDVVRPSSVRDAIDSATSRFGAISILVNCAAKFRFGTIDATTASDLEDLFKVNVVGYHNCISAVLPSMRWRGGGSIINIASVSAFIGEAGHYPYSISKSAILSLTKCLAVDLATDHIRVNALSPGAIRTPATDKHIAALGLDPEQAYKDFGNESLMKRMGDPREIAYGALFLASDESSFMTGANLVMDGGASID